MIARLGVVATLLLASCALPPPPAPQIPTPAEVAANALAVVNVNLSPQRYFEASVDLSIKLCSAWFDSLTARANSYSTASALAGIGGALAGGALGLSGGPPGAIAGTGIGTGAAQSVLGVLSNATGISYPVAIGELVEKAQNTYLASVPTPTTALQASIYASRFADLCSLRKVQSLAQQAIIGAETTVASPMVVIGSVRSFAPPPQIVAH